jgi:hypothetical protein
MSREHGGRQAERGVWQARAESAEWPSQVVVHLPCVHDAPQMLLAERKQEIEVGQRYILLTPSRKRATGKSFYQCWIKIRMAASFDLLTDMAPTPRGQEMPEAITLYLPEFR